MKIAALYDIHGNAPALEAVLAEIADLQVDTIIVGGDVVAGPMPNECLDLLNAVEADIFYILGNAESDALTQLAGEIVIGVTPGSPKEAEWVAGELSGEHKLALQTWSDTVTMAVDGIGEVLFCHASPRNNVDLFSADSTDARMATLFGDVKAQLVVCGHTHMQFDLSFGELRIVNAGSVGMSFGRKHAHWLLIDNAVHFMRTEYDLEAAATRIRTSNYHSAEDFATNNILTVPAKVDVLAFLAELEAKQISG